MKSSTFDKISCFISEVIGTALLMFLGCMGCISGGVISNNVLQMTFNFGLVVMIIVQCFACVSGAHINPSVTLAAFIYNILSPTMAAVYFVAQIIGALLGYGLLIAVTPHSSIKNPVAAHAVCITVPVTGINELQAFIIEFVITGSLIFVCCAVWDPRNKKYQDSLSIRFGLTISCLSITAGQFTGASMNPARSLAPALWNTDFESHWVYWLGPLAGSAFASLLYKFVFRREVAVAEEAPVS